MSHWFPRILKTKSSDTKLSRPVPENYKNKGDSVSGSRHYYKNTFLKQGVKIPPIFFSFKTQVHNTICKAEEEIVEKGIKTFPQVPNPTKCDI